MERAQEVAPVDHRRDEAPVQSVVADSLDSFADIDKLPVVDGSQRVVAADNCRAEVAHSSSAAVDPHFVRTCSELVDSVAADRRQWLVPAVVAHSRATMPQAAERPVAETFEKSELDFAFDNWLECGRL